MAVVAVVDMALALAVLVVAVPMDQSVVAVVVAAVPLVNGSRDSLT